MMTQSFYIFSPQHWKQIIPHSQRKRNMGTLFWVGPFSCWNWNIRDKLCQYHCRWCCGSCGYWYGISSLAVLATKQGMSNVKNLIFLQHHYWEMVKYVNIFMSFLDKIQILHDEGWSVTHALAMLQLSKLLYDATYWTMLVWTQLDCSLTLLSS